MIDIAPPQQLSTPTSSQRCPLRALMAVDFEHLRESLEEFIAALEVDERKLGQVGARLELSLLRAEPLRDFGKLLRQHAHRKDAVYAWGEVHLSAQARIELLQRLRGPLQCEGPNGTEQGSLPFQVAI